MDTITEVKNKAAEIKDVISKAGKILLTCHPHPDADSIGTGLALYEYLTSIGKKVDYIAGDSGIVPFMKNFPLSENILNKNIFDINFSDYDLFLIHDIGSLEMISKKSGFSLPEGLNSILIDHHFSNTGFGKLNLICKKAPSTAEIIYLLIKEMGGEITHSMALNLMMGIWTDTGGFQYPLTNTVTFEIATEISKIAPDYPKTLSNILNSLEKADIKYVGMTLGSLKEFADGKLAVTMVTKEELEKNGIGKDNISSHLFINMLKAVSEWGVVATMVEEEAGNMKCSFRTNNPDMFDLTKIATALGGGGHKAAAGANIKLPPEEARNLLVKTYEEIYKK